MTAPPHHRAEAAAGAWLAQSRHRRARARRLRPTGGRRIEVDLWLQPGAAVARAHVHEHLVERFEVRRGRGRLAGRRRSSASRAPATGPSRCRPAPCTTGGTPATASPTSASRSTATPAAPGQSGRPLRVDDRGDVVARRARPRRRAGHARPAVAGGDRARVPRRDPLHQAARRRPGRALRAARRDRPPDRPRPPRARSSTGPRPPARSPTPARTASRAARPAGRHATARGRG